MSRSTERIITAVSYSDVFDYPLTEEEVLAWSGVRSFPPGHIRGLVRAGGFVVRAGREKIITLRKKRARIAVAKWARARRVGALLGRIPTVMLVGVTGGLSVNNADTRDDIDIFIIARRGTLWSTRLATTLLADFLGLRRKPGSLEVADKICLNMFMSDDALSLPVSERDLFSAHEVLQMVPVFDRQDTYNTFLRANRWVARFAPNMWKRVGKGMGASRLEDPSYTVAVFRLFEQVVRACQLWYMGQRRTSEVIRQGVIRFHPRDAREWIRERLEIRLHKWRIPLDKVFYHP